MSGENKIAAYIGISGPETPKYMLTNNFLTDYFQAGKEGFIYDFQKLELKGVLHVEDDFNREKLEKSFNAFMKRYSGEEAIKEGNKRQKGDKRYYFPLNQEMLTSGSNINLRRILFALQCMDDKHFDYKDMQSKLAAYIFCDSSGINYILRILLQNQNTVNYRNRTVKERHEIACNFWNMLSKSELSRINRLGKQLNEDLNVLLSHEYFNKLDFYRKYNYLSILLTSYIIHFIVTRQDANNFILCKGAPSDSRLNGMMHSACCSNYKTVRSVFPTLLQKYYREVLSKEVKKGKLKIVATGKVVIISDMTFNESAKRNMTFNEFAKNVMGSKAKKEKDYSEIVEKFGLIEGKINRMPIEDFILRYIDITRSSSTLTKIISTLPTCGKQIGLIFPGSNTRQKYFALSSSLAEFYVRLYLAKKKQKYAYLDNFIEYLQNRYKIVLVKSKVSEAWLQKSKLNITAQEFAKNKAALIDTLNSVNCLIKLSDSGYVITLPEEKGDFKLI